MYTYILDESDGVMVYNTANRHVISHLNLLGVCSVNKFATRCLPSLWNFVVVVLLIGRNNYCTLP